MIVRWLHYLGSSMFVVMIAYVVVDICRNKKMTVSSLLGRVLLLILFILALARSY